MAYDSALTLSISFQIDCIPRPDHSRWSWVSYSVCLRYLLREKGCGEFKAKNVRNVGWKRLCVCVRETSGPIEHSVWLMLSMEKKRRLCHYLPASSRELFKLSWASECLDFTFSCSGFFAFFHKHQPDTTAQDYTGTTLCGHFTGSAWGVITHGWTKMSW